MAAKFARVERWVEDSGNAALMGRELPPAEVLAADQRITAWARELGRPGWRATWTQLRARAYLDLLLGKDSRPRRPAPAARTRAPAANPDGPGGPGWPGSRRVRRPGHPDRPAGHPDRSGGPARRAVRPGPGRPVAGPRPRRRRRAQPEDDVVRDGDRRAGARRRPRLRPARTQESRETRRSRPAAGGTGFSFTPASRDGPPGGYGTWRLRTPGPGPDLIVTLDPLDHRPVRPPVRSPGPRPRGQAAAPVPGPARHLHQPHLPAARRQCDFEHNTPYEAGGRTCLCNGGPQCKR